jgi:hypothetical protein
MWHKKLWPIWERKCNPAPMSVLAGKKRVGNILPKYQYTFLLVQSEDLISFFRTKEGWHLQLLKDFWYCKTCKLFHWNFDKTQTSFGVSLKRASFSLSIAVFSWNWTFQLHRNIFKGVVGISSRVAKTFTYHKLGYIFSPA